MRTVGIMQGRLTRQNARLQSFPDADWEEEFEIAARLGFDGIEWLLDSDSINFNPMMNDTGRTRIRELSARHGIAIRSLCADYFIDHPIHHPDRSISESNATTLSEILNSAAKIGVEVCVLPAVEQAGLKSIFEQEALIEALHQPLETARESGILLALETDLKAEEQLKLIQQLQHPQLGVAYDCGNAVAAGFDPTKEIRILEKFLLEVHIKDKSHEGKNVALGTGAMNFSSFFTAVEKSSFRGPLILETTPGSHPVQMAQQHIQFVHRGFQHK